MRAEPPFAPGMEAPAAALMAIPASMDFVTAAAFGMAYKCRVPLR